MVDVDAAQPLLREKPEFRCSQHQRRNFGDDFPDRRLVADPDLRLPSCDTDRIVVCSERPECVSANTARDRATALG